MSCIYRNNNMCTVVDNVCPWIYYCGKIGGYKEREGVDKYCMYKKQEVKNNAPDGYYSVNFERKGFLYIAFNDQTLKLANPFDYVPEYVKLYQSKGVWKIKKEKEKKG